MILADTNKTETIRKQLEEKNDVLEVNTVLNHDNEPVYFKVVVKENSKTIRDILNEHNLTIGLAKITDNGNLHLSLGVEKTH